MSFTSMHIFVYSADKLQQVKQMYLQIRKEQQPTKKEREKATKGDGCILICNYRSVPVPYAKVSTYI